MGTFFLADDAGVGCANWVVRALVSDVASVLAEVGASDLARWLTSEESPAFLYGHFDVRNLTASNQGAFLAALGPARDKALQRGGDDWNVPEAFAGYIRLFDSLVHQTEQLARGERPTELPNLSGVSPHDGAREGPGWEHESGDEAG